MPTVCLYKDAYTHILEEAIRRMPCETGGVLMGYWGNEGEAVVTAVIGPGPKAIHKPTSFVPDSAYHRCAIAAHYQASGRTETYLGDWHTHPYANSYLSGTDKATLAKIARFEPARLDKPLMLVLGTRPFELGIWAHTFVKSFCGNKSVETACKLRIH